ncbi:MAG: hypothetical protein NC299_03685 [Lachnospiraceae bacterium]|nr:hypothetical protein [Ruminococcus sp.]MCM1274450.1 hypothetical protein [Lachnospiraceae bacterium]
MKFSKIVSAAAAIAAAGMMTVSASASMMPTNEASRGTQMIGDYHIVLYYDGNGTSADANKPVGAIEGLDLSKIAKAVVTFTIEDCADRDWFVGGCGGAFTVGINGGDLGTGDTPGDKYNDYNWQSLEWYGVNDDDLGLVAVEDKDIQANKVGDYTYQLVNEFKNPLANGDATTIGQVQVQLNDWGAEMARTQGVKLEVMDANDNVLITFDELGNYTLGGSSAPAAPANNVDTGVESVAAVVGVAALAAGAVVLSRKRK